MDVHAWMRPRLEALVAEARTQGIALDVSVAVITDIVTSAGFGPALPPPDENWNRDPGEPDAAVNADLTHEPGADMPHDNAVPHQPLMTSRRWHI